MGPLDESSETMLLWPDPLCENSDGQELEEHAEQVTLPASCIVVPPSHENATLTGGTPRPSPTHYPNRTDSMGPQMRPCYEHWGLMGAIT